MPKVVVALGSNLGDRAAQLLAGLRAMHGVRGTRVDRTSFLYETPPMHFTAQPSFLNAACEVTTELPPLELLAELKAIEAQIGRQPTFQNGPRVLDLDILLYDQCVVDSPGLSIPHPRLHERAFVLRPVNDLLPTERHPLLAGRTMAQLLSGLPANDLSGIQRVMPVAGSLLPLDGRTLFAGILNITPDSFSDGGQHNSLDAAMKQVDKLLEDGADMIDIGGESTRPGSRVVPPAEEIVRVLPVIQRIRDRGLNCMISIDTRNAEVAAAAIAAGANIINDVSGGQHDNAMLTTASALGVPIILMHMRGTPSTMTDVINTTYRNGDVVTEVAREMSLLCSAADRALIPTWLQLTDPGVGFAKQSVDNVKLLHGDALRTIRRYTGNRPMMVGISRKRFLIDTLQQTFAGSTVTVDDRDAATAALCCSLAASGVEILRVHNVRSARAAMAASQLLSSITSRS